MRIGIPSPSPFPSFVYMQVWLSDTVLMITIGVFLLPDIIIMIVAVITDPVILLIDVIAVNDVSF